MKAIEAIGNKNGIPETIFINFPNFKWIKVIDKYENEQVSDKKLLKLGMATNYTISKKEWENLESYLNHHEDLLRIDTIKGDLYFMSLKDNDWVKVKKGKEDTDSGEMDTYVLNFTKTTTVTVSSKYFHDNILDKLLEYSK